VALDESDEKLFADRLFQAASVLDKLIADKHKVYVHCCAGVTRGPTMAIVYLALMMKVKDWQNTQKVEKLVHDAHPVAHPNMKAVAKTLQEYQWFRDQLLEEARRKKEEEERRRRELEAERQRREKIWK